MAEERTPLLETVDLKKYFKVGDKSYLHAVDGINMKVYAGETIGVVGESGCGKSTLGRTILRLIEPTSGQILYNGQDITKYNARQMKKMRQELQIIFQDPYASLDPRKSVIEIIAEYMLINKTLPTKKEIFNHAAHLMDVVGLARRYATAYPHELDGGRRQRIGIARALALDPEFIICDEPVSALDVSIQAQILNLLKRLQQQNGYTYLFITHDLAVVKHISNEVLVMYLGQMVEKAPTAELFRNPRHPYTQALLSAIPVPSLDEKKPRMLLKGELTSPINPKPACRFAPRCPYAKEQCRCSVPEITDLGSGHTIRCFYPQG